MKYLDKLKASKTIKLALAQKLLGVVTVISANMGYFEDSLMPATFGTILIVLGISSHLLREITTQPLGEK